MRQVLALVTGLSFPVATFLNIQAIAVPGWLSNDANGCGPPSGRADHVFLVVLLSFVSLGFGLLGTGCLFVRMLEKKIKWMTRLFVVSALSQGSVCLLLLLFLVPLKEPDCRFTEAFVYTCVCAFMSLSAGLLAKYQQHLNRSQYYVYTIYQLSAHQRQLILLTIATLAFISITSASYLWLEGWGFNDASYWCITTFATIGLGDLVPSSTLSMALFPIFSSTGILIVGSLIFALRNVVLELITLQLASKFSRQFHQNDFSLSDSDWEEEATPPPPRLNPHFSIHGNLSQPHLFPSTTSSSPFIHPHHHHLSTKSPMIHPTSSEIDLFHRHTNADALDLAASVRDTSRERNVKFNISRSAEFPTLSIAAQPTLEKREIIAVTKSFFIRQILYAFASLLINMGLFGSVFAYLEGWKVYEGWYFSYCVLSTIGYGDYHLRNGLARALFIWHVFIGIGSITYLSSLIAEWAMDRWTIEIQRIEQRVDRYEQKAKIKKMFKNKDITTANRKPLNPSDIFAIAPMESPASDLEKQQQINLGPSLLVSEPDHLEEQIDVAIPDQAEPSTSRRRYSKKSSTRVCVQIPGTGNARIDRPRSPIERARLFSYPNSNPLLSWMKSPVVTDKEESEQLIRSDSIDE